MIKSVCIFAASPISIIQQAKLFQAALSQELPSTIPIELIVLPPISSMPPETIKKIRSCDVGVFLMDPFYYLSPMSLPKHAFFKFTVDGVQQNSAINNALRLICDNVECFANSEYSKKNLEVHNIKINGLIYDGIRNVPSPPINPVSLFTIMGLYNHGGHPIMDRKGQLIATALLVKLLHNHDFNAIIGSNPDYLMHVASKYVEVLKITQKTLTKDTGLKIEQVRYGFGNNLINYPHKLFSYVSIDSLMSGSVNNPGFNFVLIGGLGEYDVRMLYSLSRFFLFPSLTEGFGVPPLEAMNSGRFVIANSYQTARELLPSDCTYFIKPHHIKIYYWGVSPTQMKMTYIYPDMDDFLNILTKAIMGDISYDPFKCVQASLRFEYKKTYEPLIKKVMETIK